ncbi:MAG: hypothetical protein KJO79_05530, partial [Verrucomicrobiae bacterium]|nr:hypothetical protein [Verrucomicrobiae bacterium]NNJ86622.1 hypothetical protein [Akkermansiaceae bacterium]
MKVYTRLFICFFVGLAIIAPLTARQAPAVHQDGGKVVLKNDVVRFEFDLQRGTYAIFNQADPRPVVANARLGINQWFSDAAGVKRSWTKRKVIDDLGSGLALDLSVKPDGAPELLFSITLYQGQSFISATGGLINSGNDPVRVKDIHILADGAVYQDYDLSEGFAMIDGFNGGEPLEYGKRSYSPLTRVNALKSRNNILLTFSDDTRRRQLVMGGLSYHDFDKFATIAQPRRTELAKGADGKSSLRCYLDLPSEQSDSGTDGEVIELIKGKESRRWENHEFRCSEMATSAKGKDEIIIECRDLKKDQPYRLGFSWWHGLRHGNHADLTQSVYVEFEQDGGKKKLPLVESCILPRFDGHRKKDVEQVELLLPAEAIKAGKLRVIVEKAAGTDEKDQNVYLSEIWLRDGRGKALLPSKLTSVAASPRPRLAYTGQLFASDPVGKRVDPGQRYVAPDLFYIDVTGADPFDALERYAAHLRKAQNIKLSIYDFPTVCLWYAADKRYGGIGKEGANNTSLGAVEEAEVIAASGFLKYSRAAVRLVPDSYMPDNQQGWWDDKHWQRDDTDRDTTQNGRYIKPYETTEK